MHNPNKMQPGNNYVLENDNPACLKLRSVWLQNVNRVLKWQFLVSQCMHPVIKGSLAENGKINQCVKKWENGHKQLKTKTDTDKQKCKKEMANGVETWGTKKM